MSEIRVSGSSLILALVLFSLDASAQIPFPYFQVLPEVQVLGRPFNVFAILPHQYFHRQGITQRGSVIEISYRFACCGPLCCIQTPDKSQVGPLPVGRYTITARGYDFFSPTPMKESSQQVEVVANLPNDIPTIGVPGVLVLALCLAALGSQFLH